MSGDGTMTAATSKLPRTAYFQRLMGTLLVRRYYRVGSYPVGRFGRSSGHRDAASKNAKRLTTSR
jgi:hypothetical protein